MSASLAASMLPEDMRRDTNTTVKPCDNFYEFTCGGWVARTVMTQDKTVITRYTLHTPECKNIS